MKEIKLSKVEYEYLHVAHFLTNKWRVWLSYGKQKENCYSFTIENDQADELRDLFGERLQIVGFDAEYKLTNEGEILESLIDKFFCE